MRRNLYLLLLTIFTITFLSCKDDVTNPTEAPTISIVSPAKNSNVSENTEIKIEAFDSGTIVRVEVYLNHSLYFVADSQKSFYKFNWESRYFPDGSQVVIEAVAYDDDGNKVESKATIVHVYHFMPTDLTAEIISNSEIMLNWVDNSKIEDGFFIEEKIDNSKFSIIAKLDSNITSYKVIKPIDTSHSYYFRVRAFNSKMFSSYTPTIKAEINLFAPTNLSGILTSDTSLSLSWTDNNDFEKGYFISINSQLVAETNQNQDSITISYVFFTNHTYEIRVYAFSDNFIGGYSDPIYLTFRLDPPNGLKLYDIQNDKTSLTWNTNSTYVTRFVVERKAAESNFSQIAETQQNVFNYIDNDLDTSETYYYRVKAVTNLNQSDYSDEIEVGYSQNMKVAETITVPFGLVHGEFSGDYKYFFRGSGSLPEMYDVKDFSYLRTFEAPTDTANTNMNAELLSNFDGSKVVRYYYGYELSARSLIAVWNAQNGNLDNFINMHYTIIDRPFSFTNNGLKLLSLDYPRMHVFSLETGTILSTFSSIYTNSSFLSNPTSNQYFILHSSYLSVFNLDDQIKTSSFSVGAQTLLTSSKDGTIVATLDSYPASIKLWNVETGNLISETTIPESVGQASVSKDNKFLFFSTESDSNNIFIYDIARNKIASEFSVNQRIIHLSVIDEPFDLISINNNERTYWTFEKDWLELK